MSDQTDNPSSSSAAVWPPPPTLPAGPKLVTMVDGIEIVQDNETLTLRNVRKSIPISIILFAICTITEAYIAADDLRNLAHQSSGRSGGTGLTGSAIFHSVLHLGLAINFAVIAVGAYCRMFTYFTFTKSETIAYLATMTTVQCPVSLVSHFRVGNKITTYHLTLRLFNTSKRSSWDFLKGNPMRHIAFFRNSDDATRVARELADFADARVEFR